MFTSRAAPSEVQMCEWITGIQQEVFLRQDLMMRGLIAYRRAEARNAIPLQLQNVNSEHI